MRLRMPALVVVLALTCALAQNQSVPVKVQVLLVDKDLNQKPVPRFGLVLRRIDDRSTPSATEVKTGLDGVAQVQLAAGRYLLSVVQPLEFQSKTYKWEIEITVSPPGTDIVLSNDNAIVTEVEPRQPSRITDELTNLYRKYQASVVTVWSEFGRGTGFVVDPAGLILTNQHVIGPSEYIAVQFDPTRKVRATLLIADASKDIAVLWADLSAFPDAIVAPLAKEESGQPIIVEGERVFTIGSPLHQRKILTTGVASKIEQRAIISDININPGNSGGPLFNSVGEVVGITTFGDPSRGIGPGVSGIVRIEQAIPLLEIAKREMSVKPKPSAALLPVEPQDTFPLESIKSAIAVEKFDTKPYIFGAGKFDVAIITPILYYRLQTESELRAVREKEKRTKKSQQAVRGTFRPLEDLKNWAEYVGEYQPVLLIRARPKLAETTGSLFLRVLVSPYIPAKVRFKTDFYKMKLLCGSKEIEPIQPGKVAHLIDVQGPFVNATDATYEGVYVYPYDAISSSCGQVALQLFSEKDPNKSEQKILDTRTLEHVSADFAPYASVHAAAASSKSPN